MPNTPKMNSTDNHDDEHYIAGAHGTIAPQKDEAYYDDRSDASDDMEKGQLKFPKSLYGREKELDKLLSVYNEILVNCNDDRGNNNSSDGDSPGANIDAQDNMSTYKLSQIIWLGGYSGIGKTALVNEFIKRAQTKYTSSGSSESSSSIVHASGKYSEQCNSSAPFSAIANMLDNLAIQFSRDGENKTTEKEKVCKNINSSEFIGPGKEGNVILCSTFPGLSQLINPDDTRNSSSTETSAQTTSLNAIKECTLELLSCICNALDNPLILFLDDMQWGDSASFDMLQFLLSSKDHLHNIMFICSFRSNEVDEDHPFTTLMNNVVKERDGSKSVERMDLFSLSPEAITKFIADSVKKEDDSENEVSELGEAIYKKTMGNIFFVMQALEELVRKNVVFYDMMCFEWRWVVSKVELENYMSDDVVETVKGKIKELPDDVQHLLVVMAHIPNPLDVAILTQLMNDGSVGHTYEECEVGKLLKQSSEEGMLLLSMGTNLYAFAHDRIRQASLEFGRESDEEIDKLTQHISQVLLNSADGPGMDWCLFVAVDLVNTLPPEKSTMKTNDLVKLNLSVSKIAGERGSMEKANELLRKGLEYLESSETLWKDYSLTLELFNAIIISEYNLGSYEQARLAIEQVLDNAKSLDDKMTAYIHQLYCEEKETSDYARIAVDGSKILNMYGCGIPSTLTKVTMMKEEAKFKLALKNDYAKLLKLKMNEGQGLFQLITSVNRSAMFSGNNNLSKVLCWKAIEMATKEGMDRYFPPIVSALAVNQAKAGKLKAALEVGNVALALRERILYDLENRAMIQFIISTCVSCLMQPFRNSLDPMLEAHKDFKLVGNSEMTLASMLAYYYCYFAAGLELGPIIESKLVLSEGHARSLNKSGFLIVYQILRQFALNLRTRNESPTEFRGPAFCEEDELDAMNEKARKMALRDSSSYRLQLAVIFNNEQVMETLLEILKDYPMADIEPSRLHNRLCFTGLAAFKLGSKGNKSFVNLGDQCLSYYEKQKEQGSVNAKPVYLFMMALKRPSGQAFSMAIDACAEANFVHLEAMAREQYALFLYKENNISAGNEYMAASFWLYRDWRADFKALTMSEEYEFLKNCKRKNAKSTTATSTTASESTGKYTYAFNSTFKSKKLVKKV